MARSKETEGFDPAIHCGAEFRPMVGGKNPCQNPKGPDGGYCPAHSKKRAPKNSPGRPRSAIPTATSRLGKRLYDDVLSPHERELLEKIRSHSPEAILQENFYYLQARGMGLIARKGELTQQGKSLMQVCARMVDDNILTEEFVMELRSKLLNFSVTQAAALFNSTVPLVQASKSLGKNATAEGQARMLSEFLIFALQATDIQAIKRTGLDYLQRLKLDAGVDLDELIERYGIEMAEDDPEGEGDGDEGEQENEGDEDGDEEGAE